MTTMTGDHDRSEQLTRLRPGPPAQEASTTQLRLVIWNVQHAAPTRACRQAAWLASRPEADVVVLTEVKDAPGGHALVQALGGHGYRVNVPAKADGGYLTPAAVTAEPLLDVDIDLAALLRYGTFGSAGHETPVADRLGPGDDEPCLLARSVGECRGFHLPAQSVGLPRGQVGDLAQRLEMGRPSE